MVLSGLIPMGQYSQALKAYGVIQGHIAALEAKEAEVPLDKDTY